VARVVDAARIALALADARPGFGLGHVAPNVRGAVLGGSVHARAAVAARRLVIERDERRAAACRDDASGRCSRKEHPSTHDAESYLEAAGVA
jgi:hypothetical protein